MFTLPLSRKIYVAIIAGLSALALLAALWLCDHLLPLPLPDASTHYARVVSDRNGTPLRVFADSNGVWRYPVALEQVSPLYIEALLNYEDRWFYSHPGVNPLAMLRAIAQRVYYRQWVSGGSTITMQVARILEPHSRTFLGKSHQILRALQLEWHLDKADILTLYLNHAPFGGTIEGVQAASFAYFNKPAAELSHAEAALLAVLPQAPSRLRPDRHPKRAQAARDKVLARLEHFNVWPESVVHEARDEQVFAHFNSQPKIAPLLARRLIREHPSQRVINTTLDINLQIDVEQIVNDYTQSTPDKSSAAVLIVNNHDMSVQAYVGSADFDDTQRFGHVDMITAIRSPGSTLKPFLYAQALDQGLIHEQSLLLDVPSDFSGYEPKNFDSQFSGPVSARDALRRSLNVPAVQLLDALTPEYFYAQLVSAGIPLKLAGDRPNLSMILGGLGASLENLTRGFSAFSNNGLVKPIRYLSAGEPSNHARRMMSEEAAWVTANMLQGSSLDRFEYVQSLAHSTSTIAYKTGTSYGHRDAWVFATATEVTIGVWVGRPDGTAMFDNNGRHSAVPLLNRILPLLPQRALRQTNRPQAVTQHNVCWPTGALKMLQEPHWCMQTKHAWLIDELAPVNYLKDPSATYWRGQVISLMLDEQGNTLTPTCNKPAVSRREVALWPRSLEPWLPLKWRRETLIPPISPNCKNTLNLHALTILGIDDNAILTPAPGQRDLPPMTLSTEGEEVDWFVNGHWQTKATTMTLDSLHAGEYALSVMDTSGRFSELTFAVAKPER